jgi:hypothetical protein
VRFWAFLGNGSSKTPQKRFGFCKKPMSKTFPKKIDKHPDVRFSSNLFFIAFSGVSQEHPGDQPGQKAKYWASFIEIARARGSGFL